MRAWPWTILWVPLSLACSLSLTATPPTATPDAGLVRSDRQRRPVTADPAALATLTQGQRAFAFDLYQALRAESGNLIYSPYSIAGAFALAQAGARGATEAEIASIFHFPPAAILHPTLSALDQNLNTPQPTPGPDPSGTPQPDRSFQLRVANAAWGQRDYPFEPAYLDQLAEDYGAGMHTVDFRDPETAAREINRWVADQTADRITDLVPPDQITPDTRLALTNAIYFKGGWVGAFVPRPQPLAFTTASGETIQAPAISLADDFRYAFIDDVHVIDVPYDGHRISFVVLAPPAGALEAFENRLTQDWFDNAVAGLRGTPIVFSMPKLDYESRLALAPTLQSLGLNLPFQEGQADFSGIDGTLDLFISSVIHQANITLDETGTEAAAATALLMEVGAAPPTDEPFTLLVDRPYVYVIYDHETGAILFVGRVTDPTR